MKQDGVERKLAERKGNEGRSDEVISVFAQSSDPAFLYIQSSKMEICKQQQTD